MTEPEMIEALGRAIAALAPTLADLETTRGFYDVGEWLLAFEGLQHHLVHDKVRLAAVEPDYSALMGYFEDYLDDWHREMHDEVVVMNGRK